MTWTVDQDGLNQPGLDCLTGGHISVEHTERGVWPTENDQVPWASWCLWCGAGVSNELIDEGGGHR